MQTRTIAIFLLLCVSLVGGVQAASLLEAPSGSADGTWLPVMVSGISQATSVQFDLRYDPAVVTLDGIQLAPAYAGASMTVNTNEAGRARVLVIFPDPVNIPSPTAVVEVAFSVAGGGSSSLTLEDARWSDFPAFSSIAFESVAAGGVTAGTATAVTSGGGGGGEISTPAPAATTTVTAGTGETPASVVTSVPPGAGETVTSGTVVTTTETREGDETAATPAPVPLSTVVTVVALIISFALCIFYRR
ncbi:cohesin domain-containing protein [Methanoculleus sp.]|uniref:cohesin domain-containing protein n=1 Tax=Methanoculleus sp. TaxID=90427 RepID=UPI00263A1DE2|nr:cohesin domain-containing protein [Methanoculleus sp.]MDI6867366.1 cohesin domain-containing protein [Methanoculleus sp.]